MQQFLPKNAYCRIHKLKCIHTTGTKQKQRPTSLGTDQVWPTLAATERLFWQSKRVLVTLPLRRGGRCREIEIRVNVWIVRLDQNVWPLYSGGRCRELQLDFSEK